MGVCLECVFQVYEALVLFAVSVYEFSACSLEGPCF